MNKQNHSQDSSNMENVSVDEGSNIQSNIHPDTNSQVENKGQVLRNPSRNKKSVYTDYPDTHSLKENKNTQNIKSIRAFALFTKTGGTGSPSDIYSKEKR